MSVVTSDVVEMSVLSLSLSLSLMPGIHRCSLHHSQSQEEGEGKEREGGGEDGSGEWGKQPNFPDSLLIIVLCFFSLLFWLLLEKAALPPGTEKSNKIEP